MADTAADVPSKYDVVINGHGYILWRQLMQSLPFRNQRAAYSYTPTFIARTNVSGSYGDDQQDFFLTANQHDWSLGDGQHYIRVNDTNSSRRFWSATRVEVSTEGAASIRLASTSQATAAAVLAACNTGTTFADYHAYATSTHLYTLIDAGTAPTDQGAHGAGTPNQWGMCSDGKYLYIAGASKIRSWDGISTFADFYASGNAGAIATLNNSLYSCNGSTLNVYSTGGAQTNLFTWKDNKGGALGGVESAKLTAFGGDLLVFFQRKSLCPQLWMYDGTSTFKVAELPAASTGYDTTVVQGIVFMSAQVYDTTLGHTGGQTNVIYAWTNGTLSEIWRSPVTSIQASALGTHRGNLVFTDNDHADLYEYDLRTGAVSHAALFSPTASAAGMLTSGPSSVALMLNTASDLHVRSWPYDVTAFASTATLTSSNFDFDNSLTKVFRGVKVDYIDGGNIDIAYLIDGDISADAYTTLQSGATGGLEYLFPANTRGRAISIRLTLNNNGAGGKATLKRLYVRASPVQQSYRRCQYVLDLGGTTTSAGGIADTVQLMNGTPSALTGAQMAANLVASITSTSPISVTDRFGTYTAVFEQGEGITELDEVRPGEFVAQVTLREV